MVAHVVGKVVVDVVIDGVNCNVLGVVVAGVVNLVTVALVGDVVENIDDDDEVFMDDSNLSSLCVVIFFAKSSNSFLQKNYVIYKYYFLHLNKLNYSDNDSN